MIKTIGMLTVSALFAAIGVVLGFSSLVTLLLACVQAIPALATLAAAAYFAHKAS